MGTNIVDADEVIKRLAARRDELLEENRMLREDLERCRQEGRDSARVVGGILRLLCDNGLIDRWERVS